MLGIRRWVSGLFVFMLAWSFELAAQPHSLDELLRPAEVNWVELSPKGDYYAISVPVSDRVVVAILRREDMQVTARIDPGRNGTVDSIIWVDDHRLFASWSFKVAQFSEPVGANMIYAVNADGTERRAFYGAVVDPLIHKPGRVLVRSCVRIVASKCRVRLQEVSANGRGRDVDIVDAPLPDAMFVTDRNGAPRFAWGIDDDDMQSVYLREGDAWTLLNDEAASGIRISPIGFDYDLRSAYLWTERAEGPDVIERMDLATGARAVVASHPRRNPHSIVYSLDGREPIGVRYGPDVPGVMFFDESHPHATFVRAIEAEFPGRYAHVVSSTRDGRAVVVRATGDREPAQYFEIDAETGDMRMIVRSHPWLEPSRLAATVPVELLARDGLSLDALLTRPVNGGTEAPLVVLVHGGPFGVEDVWGFDREVQILAAQGYAVMQVNFRGSGGRGRSFERMGYREWGGAMQRDVTDATRWAQAQAGIDPGRACIMGASYGAYAALMGVAQEPDLYRCAIGFAGPYDLPTMFRWGDTQRSKWGRNKLTDILGTTPAELRAASATTHAPRIRANLLLIQGSRDFRVSPEHFKAMQRALDAAGVRYESMLLSGEAHGVYTPSNQRDYYTRVLDTLGRSLGSAVPSGPAPRDAAVHQD